MTPNVRTAILLGGLVFCFAFAYLTIVVIARSGLDFLTLTSILIIAMIAIGLIGAIRNPPVD